MMKSTITIAITIAIVCMIAPTEACQISIGSSGSGSDTTAAAAANATTAATANAPTPTPTPVLIKELLQVLQQQPPTQELPQLEELLQELQQLLRPSGRPFTVVIQNNFNVSYFAFRVERPTNIVFVGALTPGSTLVFDTLTQTNMIIVGGERKNLSKLVFAQFVVGQAPVDTSDRKIQASQLPWINIGSFINAFNATIPTLGF